MEDPTEIEEIYGQYLARVLAKGLKQPTVVGYWHQFDEQVWQDFPGRSQARVLAYLASVRVGGAATRDLVVTLKTTPSRREAMFHSQMAQLLAPHVPKAYHVVVRPEGQLHWIFMEHIPCMVLGPLWEGREFSKALKGLVAIHSRFWQRCSLLDSFAWLPRMEPESILRQCRLELDCVSAEIQQPWLDESLQHELQRLLRRADESWEHVTELAYLLTSTPWTLLHRDYHPANVGTHDRSTQATPIIVDWSSCAAGPPQLDLAHFVDGMQGLLRPKPAREALVRDYCTMLVATGVSLPPAEVFEPGLEAAAFFDDIHGLSVLCQNREDEAAWRENIFYNVSEEAVVRMRRARGALSSTFL